MPVSDIASLEGAGLQVAGIAEKDLDEDELAVAHYRVLSHDLVPDAGVFLEDEGMLGGPLARSLHVHMTSTGGAGRCCCHHQPLELPHGNRRMENRACPCL